MGRSSGVRLLRLARWGVSRVVWLIAVRVVLVWAVAAGRTSGLGSCDRWLRGSGAVGIRGCCDAFERFVVGGGA